MEKASVIKNALKILQEDLAANNEISISIHVLGFMNTFTQENISGEFSGIVANEFNEGIYFNTMSKVFYYYGEAYYDNPGSFSNIFGFSIEGDDLDLLPDRLKEILKRVGTTKKTETISLEDSNSLEI